MTVNRGLNPWYSSERTEERVLVKHSRLPLRPSGATASSEIGDVRQNLETPEPCPVLVYFEGVSVTAGFESKEGWRCAVCSPTSAGTQSAVVFRDDVVVVRLMGDSHSMSVTLAPRRHRRSFAELSTTEAMGLGRVLRFASIAVEERTGQRCELPAIELSESGHLYSIIRVPRAHFDTSREVVETMARAFFILSV